MHITIILIITYVLSCARIATAPWRYWQLNARYFSNEKGVFSKLSMDSLIPERWKLVQTIDSDALVPSRYPVFLKPEWGQNAHGIYKIDTPSQLTQIRKQLASHPTRYLLQEAAPGQREFELFSIDINQDDDHHDVFTVTEAINTSEHYPINSKYNQFTRYADITSQFTTAQLDRLAAYLSQTGKFGISRMSVRADDLNALIEGDFHIIEINLFLPMPINLLDADYSWREKWHFIRSSMMSLARATKMIKPVDNPQPIFTRMMMYGRSNNPSGNNHHSPEKMREQQRTL